MLFIKNLKLDKVNEGGGAGGMPLPPTVKSAAEQPPAEATPPAETPGAETDHNFGYEPTPPADTPAKKEGEAPKAGDTPPETPVTKISEVKDPGTGYREEPPKVDATPPVVPPVTPPAEPDEFDKALSDIPKADAAEIKAFATENKIPVEVAKKWGEKVKANVAAVQAQRANMERQAEQEKITQRKSWHDELKADPKFGGEKFQTNIVRAERVLADFGPDLKKQLTEGKGMLPPNVMRMLASLADKLYATDKLNPGEPPVAAAPEEKGDPIKDFYS